ncbi:MAG: heat-inducible transcription repressor HrcA [Deltaproteobacteria bacterium]|nr:heat-inducible transcription repressor HrcA [Deltaproteobacteria bacterium]MBW2070151.1 heat-inducible transcription repressor HrcA [Deltaproteobacteria bacterium]
MEELLHGERTRQVLEAVIIEYIKTGTPVGSRAIAKKYGLNVSPATIRNVMSDLEDLGLLSQPHTSAGRVPTELGLRIYVDSIVKVKALSSSERERIKRSYTGKVRKVESLLKDTSRVLSSFSKQTSMVLTPRLSTTVFKRIEFIRLRPNVVLVILVSTAGTVHNTVIETEEDIPQNELERYTRFLNDMLKNLTLQQVKERLLSEMKREKTLFDNLLAQAVKLSKQVLEKDLASSELIIDGRMNLLEYPELADLEQMRRIFAAFEEKGKIIELLDKSTAAEGVHIFIGSESELQDMERVSFVTSPYTSGEDVLGTLGVVGPIRMDYARIIPLVDYTAKLLSKMLEETF